MADTAVLDAEAKKRKRDSTPEHLRVQPVDPEEAISTFRGESRNLGLEST
jgi:hypothetical protein